MQVHVRSPYTLLVASLSVALLVHSLKAQDTDQAVRIEEDWELHIAPKCQPTDQPNANIAMQPEG